LWELNLEAVRTDLLEAYSVRSMMEKIMKLEPKTQLMTILLLWLRWNERNGCCQSLPEKQLEQTGAGRPEGEFRQSL